MDSSLGWIQFLTNLNWPVVFTIITSFVGTFALIATLTPNKSDDKIVAFLQQLVNFFGANFGKAKNDETPKADTKE